MPNAEWFERIAASLRGCDGVEEVSPRADKIVVETRTASVVIDGDLDDPSRVAVWSPVDVPTGLSVRAVVSTCEVVTADHAVEDGCVLAFNAKAGFLMLGRSTHVTELERDPADVLATLLRVRREATVIDDIARELATDAGPSASTTPPAPQPAAAGGQAEPRSKGLLGGLAGMFGGRDGR